MQVPTYDNSREIELRTHINHGNSLMARRAYKQAIDEYQKAYELDPKNQIARLNLALGHNNMGIMYFEQKKYDEANAEWEQALKVDPTQASAKRNLKILQMTLDKLGLQLGFDEPPAKETADKTKEQTKAGETEAATSKAATEKEKQPSTAAGPLKAGLSENPPGYIETNVTQPVRQSATPSAKVPASDEFDGFSTQINSSAPSSAPATGAPPSGASFTPPSGASLVPAAGSPPGYAPVATTAAPDVSQQSYAPANAVPQQSSAAASAAAQSAQPSSSTYPDPVMVSPTGQAQPADAPGTQVFEDKEAGTTIKVMAKPPAPVEQPPPPAVQALQPAAAAEPSVPVVQPPAPSSGTIDDQLTALEMKVFGRKQKSMPILKRLDKLETGTAGTVNMGTVQERVDALRHAYGL
jgi:tetratricopeptide (TPR) repeat protein